MYTGTSSKKGRIMVKNWVVIKDISSGQIKAWRDYNDDHVWGAASYEVFGYYKGSYRDALKFGSEELSNVLCNM